MRKSKFPFPHVVIEEKKEVWVRIDSSITAMGIPALMQKFFPGYTGHIASDDYFKKLIQATKTHYDYINKESNYRSTPGSDQHSG